MCSNTTQDYARYEPYKNHKNQNPLTTTQDLPCNRDFYTCASVLYPKTVPVYSVHTSIWFPALSLKTLKMPDFYRLMNNLPDADASPSLKVLQTSIQSARSHTLSFQVTLLTIPKAKHVLKLLQPLPIDTTQRGLLQGGHKVPGQVFFLFFFCFST